MEDSEVGSGEPPQETVDETGPRNIWEIVTWIFIALTLILNLVLVAILILRRNLNSIVNKSEGACLENNVIFGSS